MNCRWLYWKISETSTEFENFVIWYLEYLQCLIEYWWNKKLLIGWIISRTWLKSLNIYFYVCSYLNIHIYLKFQLHHYSCCRNQRRKMNSLHQISLKQKTNVFYVGKHSKTVFLCKNISVQFMLEVISVVKYANYNVPPLFSWWDTIININIPVTYVKPVLLSMRICLIIRKHTLRHFPMLVTYVTKLTHQLEK